VNALLHNIADGNNTANGLNALFSDTSGSLNTAMGNQTLQEQHYGQRQHGLEQSGLPRCIATTESVSLYVPVNADEPRIGHSS
jgi:hypothetical protein